MKTVWHSINLDCGTSLDIDVRTRVGLLERLFMVTATDTTAQWTTMHRYQIPTSNPIQSQLRLPRAINMHIAHCSLHHKNCKNRKVCPKRLQKLYQNTSSGNHSNLLNTVIQKWWAGKWDVTGIKQSLTASYGSNFSDRYRPTTTSPASIYS